MGWRQDLVIARCLSSHASWSGRGARVFTPPSLDSTHMTYFSLEGLKFNYMLSNNIWNIAKQFWSWPFCWIMGGVSDAESDIFHYANLGYNEQWIFPPETPAGLSWGLIPASWLSLLFGSWWHFEHSTFGWLMYYKMSSRPNRSLPCHRYLVSGKIQNVVFPKPNEQKHKTQGSRTYRRDGADPTPRLVWCASVLSELHSGAL